MFNRKCMVYISVIVNKYFENTKTNSKIDLTNNYLMCSLHCYQKMIKNTLMSRTVAALCNTFLHDEKNVGMVVYFELVPHTLAWKYSLVYHVCINPRLKILKQIHHLLSLQSLKITVPSCCRELKVYLYSWSIFKDFRLQEEQMGLWSHRLSGEVRKYRDTHWSFWYFHGISWQYKGNGISPSLSFRTIKTSTKTITTIY